MSSINKRKIRNYLLEPSKQVNSALAIFIVIFTCVALLFGYAIYQISGTMNSIAEVSKMPLEMTDLIANTKISLWTTFALMLLSLLFASILLAIAITHRYLGPIVQIRKQIRALLNGDLESRIYLRKDDQFQDLADDLNSLAERLGNKDSRAQGLSKKF